MGNQPGTVGYDPRYPSNYYKNYQNKAQTKYNQTNLQRTNSNNGNVSSSYQYPQLYNQYSQNSNSQSNNGTSQRSGSLSKKPSFGTKVQAIDKIKVGIKLTRDKVDKLISQYENQIYDITIELNKQKQNGLNNKKKAIYLLKQRKQFQKQVSNLQTRKQVVLKTLNDLNQQHLDKQMAVILEQSNQYMKNIQQELEKMDWRGILNDAASHNNYYNNQFAGLAQQDSEVDKMFEQLQKEVLGPNYKAKQIQINLPVVTIVEQINSSIINEKPKKQVYIQTIQSSSKNINVNPNQVYQPNSLTQNNNKNIKQLHRVSPIIQPVASKRQNIRIQQSKSSKELQLNQLKQIQIQKKNNQQQQKMKIQRQQQIQQQMQQQMQQQQQIQIQQTQQQQIIQQQYKQQLYQQQQYYKQQNQYQSQQNKSNQTQTNSVTSPSESVNFIKKQSKQIILAPTFEQQIVKQNSQQQIKSISNQNQSNNNIYQPPQSSQQFNQYSSNNQKQFIQNVQQQIPTNQSNNQINPFKFPVFHNQGLTLNSKMPPRPQLQQPYQQNK